MAGASVIGALRVVLGADTASLDKGLKDSQSGLQSFGNFTRGILEGVAASFVGFAAGVASSIKSAIDSADQLNKMSQSTGQTTEELSKLKYAADLSDISTESLAKSLGKLSKAMVAVATEGASPAAQAFAAMGITVKNHDGTLRSSSDVLKDIADKFAGYKDGAEKTSLAIALFGKAGAAMIPLLNQGRDGLQEAGDEAEKFGLVLDKKTTLAAEAFNDNLKKMDAIKQGLWTTITAKMLPAFELFSEQLLEVKKNSDFTSVAAEGITKAIKFVVAEVMEATVWFKSLANELTALWGVLNAPDWASLKAAWQNYTAVSDESAKSIAAVKVGLSTLWSNNPQPDWAGELLGIRAMQKEVALLGTTWTQTAAPIISAADTSKNALQKFLDTQAKSTAAQNANADSIGKNIGQQAQLKIAYEAQAIALANKIPLDTANNLLIAQAGDAAAMAAIKVAAAQAVLSLQSPYEKLQAGVAQYDLMLQNNMITVEQHRALSVKAAEDIGVGWQAMGSQVAGFAGSMSQLANTFAKDNKAMGIASKAFGIAQAIINANVAATKALAFYGPTPMGYVGVAAAIAQGAAAVAAISAQGFKTGGSMTVKGGGGPDSVPVSMMASPGEQIDVWRPDQGGGADPRKGAGSGKTIVMQGMVWGRDQIRDLVAALNDGNRDGIKLEFA